MGPWRGAPRNERKGGPGCVILEGERDARKGGPKCTISQHYGLHELCFSEGQISHLHSSSRPLWPQPAVTRAVGTRAKGHSLSLLQTSPQTASLGDPHANCQGSVCQASLSALLSGPI